MQDNKKVMLAFRSQNLSFRTIHKRIELKINDIINVRKAA